MTSSRLALIAISLVVGIGSAQDKPAKPKPLTLEQAAGKVLAAFEAKDAKALKALAEKDRPDPWLVADELCARGKHDAAAAFANAAPRKDVEKLPAYVASRRGKTPNVAAREALAAASKDGKGALAALDGVDAKTEDVVSVRLLNRRGLELRSLRRLKASAEAYLAAADAAERLGWFAGAQSAIHQSGLSAFFRSDWHGAIAAWERSHALAELRGNGSARATAFYNLGIVHLRLGDYAQALACHERSLKIREELKDHPAVAALLNRIGLIHVRRGNLMKARACYERVLRMSEKLGRGVARSLNNLGNIHRSLGDYVKARACHERSLKVSEKLGDRRGVARCLGSLGNTHHSLGDYAKALACYERSLKMSEELNDGRGVAGSLNNLGIVHRSLGDHAKALACYERSLKMSEKLKDPRGVARSLNNLGIVHSRLGDHAKALACHERSLKMEEELRDRRGVAGSLGSLGNVHESLGNYAKALAYYERSLKLSEELKDQRNVARSLNNIGLVHSYRRDYAKALRYFDGAQALATELGALAIEVNTLQSLAHVRLGLGEPAPAARAARRGVAKLPLLVGGLADEQGATARDTWAGLVENGVHAGVQLKDAAVVSFFLESGRAGALLESLGGRKTLGDAVIPEELRAKERAARAGVLAAQARHSRALRAGKRKEIRAVRADLDAARDKMVDTVATIQRAAKAAADVAYPKAAALETIQAALAPGECLVSYAVLTDGAVALVVMRDESRIVRLGKVVETLRLDDPKEPWARAADALRRAVVEPLRLGKKTTRLLVSPAGAFSFVPFGVLAPDREVVYVPSGTTYTVLLDERAKRGKGVLALGDPDYGTKRDAVAASIYRSGNRGELTPLPGTREEAKAVGDVVLLGGDASEARLRETLVRDQRWRAVHLACHGVVNGERPQLSSLALTADDRNDGFLTVIEVFQMKIPADLVVLSACETARGKVHRAEGVVGLSRAFMLAGAPRVIVSLWKVDDEATRALMVKFYALWNEHPTATALKKAQEYVASHEKWKHPYYWAAWQLWGLPD